MAVASEQVLGATSSRCGGVEHAPEFSGSSFSDVANSNADDDALRQRLHRLGARSPMTVAPGVCGGAGQGGPAWGAHR